MKAMRSMFRFLHLALEHDRFIKRQVVGLAIVLPSFPDVHALQYAAAISPSSSSRIAPSQLFGWHAGTQ
jgi:hypothetical protein